MTYLFLYRILFVIEIFTAEIMFTIQLQKRRYFALRCFLAIASMIIVAMILQYFSFKNSFYDSLVFFVLFILSIFLLRFLYDINWVSALFCGLAGYTTQHFAYELTSTVISLILVGKSPLFGLYNDTEIVISNLDIYALFWSLIYLLCFFVCYTLFYYCYAKKLKGLAEIEIQRVSLLAFIALGLIINILLNSVLLIIKEDSAVFSGIIIHFYNALCCFLLMYVQFTLVKSNSLEKQVDVLTELWHQDKEQYQMTKENIDLINLKCHDMKHQIRMYGASKSLPSEVVDEMEGLISIYDTSVETGNQVLDVLLTEKSMRCHKNNIVLSCIVDGKLLNFMNEVDIYSLFGNIFDNAIEACLKIDSPKKRTVSIKVYCVEGVILLNANNTYCGEIIFDKYGVPKTTKSEQGLHGFGIKSIQQIVDKYYGSFTIRAENGVFDLNIIFPQQQTECA